MKRSPKNTYTSSKQYANNVQVKSDAVSMRGPKIRMVTPASETEAALIKTHSASSNTRTGRRTDNVASKSRSGSTRRISDSSKRQTVVLPSKAQESYDSRNEQFSDYIPSGDRHAVRTDDLESKKINSADDLYIKNNNASLVDLLNSAESTTNKRYFDDKEYDLPGETDYEFDEIRSKRRTGFQSESRAKSFGSRKPSRQSREIQSQYDYHNRYDDYYYEFDKPSKRDRYGRKISGFKKFLAVYSCLLLIILIAGFFLFRIWTAAYEKSQPYQVAASVVKSFSNESDLEKFLSVNSSKTDCVDDISDEIDNYVSLLSGKTVSYSENSDYMTEAPSYDIKADGDVVAKITLESSDKKTFGLTSWNLSLIKIGEYLPDKIAYQVLAPLGSSVYIDGELLDSSQLTSGPGIPEQLEEASKFVDDLPNFVTYTVYLSGNPSVTAEDSSGNTLGVNISDEGTIFVGCEASDEFINSVKDIVDGAIEAWGKYFINMGTSLYYYIHTDCDWYAYIFGSDEMDPILTTLYDYEYISDFEFIEKTAENFIRYSDDCFSVDVSYKIKITFTTDERSDDNQELDATWIFVPEPGGDGWVIVDCFYNSSSSTQNTDI